MHLKRNKAPKSWPIERKGSKYVVASLAKDSIPLIMVLRDILKLANNQKNVEKMIHLSKVKVNGKIVKNKKLELRLFDLLDLGDKQFKVIIEKKKFALKDSKNSSEKIAKVIGKKTLNNGKIQVNLYGGLNYLTEDKTKVGDSAIIDFKTNKIKKIIEFKEGSKIIFISGKHIGEEGVVDKIEKEDMMIVETNTGKINAHLENIMVVN